MIAGTKEWNVYVEFEGGYGLTDEDYEDLADALAKYHAVTGETEVNTLSVTLTVDSLSPVGALTRAMNVINDALISWDLYQPAVYVAEVLSESAFNRRLYS